MTHEERRKRQQERYAAALEAAARREAEAAAKLRAVTPESATEALVPAIVQEVERRNRLLTPEGLQLVMIRSASNRPQLVFAPAAAPDQAIPRLDLWSTADKRLGWQLFLAGGTTGPIEEQTAGDLSGTIDELLFAKRYM